MKKINTYLAILIFCLLAFSSSSSFGQTYIEGRTRFFDNWRMNINFGSNLFYGDIQQYRFAPYKEDWRMAYGLMFRKQFTPVFGLGFQLLNGKLHGTKTRANQMFDAKIFDYNLHTFFDLSTMFAGYNPSRPLTLYGLAGVGFAFWNSEAKNYTTGAVERRSGFTGSGLSGRTTELVFPVGMGLRYNINDSWGLNLESTLRGVNSDRVDATVGGFQHDVYNYTMLGLTYNFNGSNLFRGDPAKREARIQRRQSRMYDREMNKYDNQVEYVKTKPTKSYEKELKKYEYEQKYNLQPKYPTAEEREMKEPTEFREQHARGDLPVVAEYDIVGIFDRDKEVSSQRPIMDEPMEVEVLQMPSATTYTTPIEVIEEEPQQGRILTDRGQKIPNILTAENVNYGETNFQTSSAYTHTSGASGQGRMEGKKITASTNISIEGLVYGVQILAKSNSRANIHSLAERYQIDTKIYEDQSNGLYRYVAGWFSSLNEANRYANILRDRGIYDAFVVAYRNGKRVSLSSINH